MGALVLVFLLALLPGLLQGLVGGGGAVLYLVVAVVVLGGDPAVMLGNGLLAAAAGAVTAAVVHGRAGRAIGPRVLWILGGAAVPCVLTPYVIDRLPSQYLFKCAAAVYCLALLVGVLLRRAGATSAGPLRCLVMGAICGATTSGFGVAGGSILAQSIQGRDFAPRQAVSAAAVVVAPLTLLASGGRLMHGTFDWGASLPLTAGAVVGAAGGARIASRVPNAWLSALTLTTSILTVLVLLAK